jgi:AcrR family transcriptional regulator
MSQTPSRRRLSATERRKGVLDAAGSLFGERGYDGTSLNEVASAAGVTKPILYRHFDSKRGLYLAVLERHRADLDSFSPLIPDQGAPPERIRAVLDAWLSYVEKHSYAWKMLFRDSGGDAEIEGFRRDVHARARAVLAQIIRSLNQVRIPEGEIEPLAELVSMGMGSLVLWWIETGAMGRETLLDALTRMWLSLLTPADAASWAGV